MIKTIVLFIGFALVFGWFALVCRIERWMEKEFDGNNNDDEKNL